MKPTIFNHISRFSEDCIVAVLPKQLGKVDHLLKNPVRNVVWFTALLKPINRLVVVGMKSVCFNHAYEHFKNGNYEKGEARLLDYITSNMKDPNIHHAVCGKIELIDVHTSIEHTLKLWNDPAISLAYDVDKLEVRHCLVEMKNEKTGEVFCLPIESSLMNFSYMETLPDLNSKLEWLSHLIKHCGQMGNNSHTNSMLYKLYTYLTHYDVQNYSFISEKNHDAMVVSV